MKELVRKISGSLGDQIGKSIIRRKSRFADVSALGKAVNFIERHREVISDPINILINRIPESGYVDNGGHVILHNGNRVPLDGPLAYYREFSDILVLNRGVHEPLEEFCFQVVLSKIRAQSPNMIELGAYWAHYSMWIKKMFPSAKCIMVEPDPRNMRCGINNFAINGYEGDFISAMVGNSGFCLDEFVSERGISSLDILHSDIQGFELEMLEGGRDFLSRNKADYIFISTHSESLHLGVINKLQDFSYRIEVSSGVDEHTTSCDGFVLASSPGVEPVFKKFLPLGRVDIARSSPSQLLDAILSVQY